MSIKDIKNIKVGNKLSLLVAASLMLSFFAPDFASANLAPAEVRLGRLGISAASNNDALIVFKLNSAPTTVAKIVITVPSGFTTTAGTPTPGVAGFPLTPASITAPPGTLTSAVTSAGAGLGGTITVSGLTSASLVNSTLYGFSIPTGSITNPATAGQYMFTVASQTSGNAPVDTTSVPVFIFGASANLDQVTVNASVAPNFSFSLSANTDTVPQVSSTTFTTSTGVTMTVGTNSPLGYTAYVASKNNSLTSATSPGTPITTGTFGTPTAMVAGTTNYGFVPSTGAACSICTGAISYDTNYNVSASQSGAFNGANKLASFEERSGYTNADQVLLQERVAVANTIGYATDYTDTLTIAAAGNF
jgi:hypothetical protein